MTLFFDSIVIGSTEVARDVGGGAVLPGRDLGGADFRLWCCATTHITTRPGFESVHPRAGPTPRD